MSVHQADNGKQSQHDARLQHAAEPTVQNVLPAAEQVGTRMLQQAEANPATATPAAILEFQRTFGNRAVQRLLVGIDRRESSTPTRPLTPAANQGSLVQRDTKPDPTKAGAIGWSDASKQRAQTSQPDVKPPKDTSWNAGETQIGSIKRIAIEGLTHGNQSKAEDLSRRGSTPESAIGKAIVLVPNDFDPKNPTTVLLHLHGFGSGYRQLDEPVDLKEQLKKLNEEKTALEKERDAASKGADKTKVSANLKRKEGEIKKTEIQIKRELDYGGVLQPGQVRDVELYRMEQQLDTLHKEQQQQKKAGKKGGPQVMAVLPQGTSSSGFGDVAEKPTEYLDEVLGKLKDKPTEFHVVLSGHSGGGPTVMRIAATLAEKEKASKKPPRVDEIILFDAINGSNESNTVAAWLNEHIAADKKALEKMKTEADVDSYFRTRARFRGYFSSGYKSLYEDVKNITDELSKKEKRKATLSLPEYKQNKLADQYRVFGPIGDKPADAADFRPHEKLIGTVRTEEEGKPAPSKTGILHEALSALD
jgi:hypothetical protein